MIGVAAVASVAMVALYVLQLFYLQLILVVWGGATMAGIVIYERETAVEVSREIGLGDTVRWSRLNDEIARVNEWLSRANREDVKRDLRMQKAYLEQELRGLSWSMKELNMEKTRLAFSPEGLKPLPPGLNWWQRGLMKRREIAHFKECTDLAAEALMAVSGEGANEELRMIANDLRAHYDFMKSMEPVSSNLRDYRIAWMVLTAISQGTNPRIDLGKHASKWSRPRLESLLMIAASRGFIQLAPETNHTESG